MAKPLWHWVDVDPERGRAWCDCGKWWITLAANSPQLWERGSEHMKAENAVTLERWHKCISAVDLR